MPRLVHACGILALVQQGPGPRPFDATTRRLIESDPVGWLTWLGLPVDGPVQPLDSEVSTALAEVDKVLRVDGSSPWLAHLEVQTGRDPELPSRMLQYHALLRHRDKVPVESTVILLRRDADGPELSGRLDQVGVTGNPTIRFWFRVVRIWQQPVDALLNGGLGVLPLAPIAAVEQAELPAIIRRLDERFEREASPNMVGELWAATDLLLGLRYDKDLAQHLLRGVRGMRESSTYQAILEEGREEGEVRGRLAQARYDVLQLGTDKFGPADVETTSALDRINDTDVLHQLLLGVLRTSSWQELLTSVSGQ
jgi:predicted transposase YdaD